MARRSRLPEHFQSAWTSSSDLEETLAAMFPPATEPVSPDDTLSPDVILSGDITPSHDSTASPDVTESTDNKQQDFPIAAETVSSRDISSPDVILSPNSITAHDFTSSHDVITNEPTPAVSTSPDVTGSSPDNNQQDLNGSTLSDLVAAPAFVSCPDVIPRNAKRRVIHECKKVQDGHSHIEQAVYQILWNSGTAQPDGTRWCSLGLAKIARDACVTERNVTVIVRRLLQKLAIEIAQNEVSNLRKSRVYRVFPYGSILARRQAAGLRFVVKGRGVEFVDKETGRPLFSDADFLYRAPPIEPSPELFPLATSGDDTASADGPDAASGEGPDVTSGGAPDATSPPLGKELLGKKQEEKTTTSATLRQLARTIHDAFGSPIDDALLRSMVETCHQNSIATIGEPAPDEILIKIVSDKAVEIARQPNLLYPKKVLAKAAAASFVGVTYEAYVEDVINKQMADAKARERQAEANAAHAQEMAQQTARWENRSRICEQHKDADGRYDLKAIAEDPDMALT